jgi:Flp pilus assembly protein TadG
MQFKTLFCVRTLLHHRRGSAAAEFAIVSFPLLVIMLGCYDFGLYVYERTILIQAVRTGAVLAYSFPTQTENIKGAVTSALPTALQTDITSLTVNIIQCSGNAGAGDGSAGCPDICSDATSGGTFVQICASLSHLRF